MSLADTFNTLARVAAGSFAVTLPDLCAVQSPTVSQGSSGGNRPAFANVSGLSAVPCMYSAAGGSERAAAGAVTAFTDYAILLPAVLADGTLVSVLPKYRIVVAARSPQPSRTFDVTTVLNESGVYLRVLAVLRN